MDTFMAASFQLLTVFMRTKLVHPDLAPSQTTHVGGGSADFRVSPSELGKDALSWLCDTSAIRFWETKREGTDALAH
ncbi:hypothetical protein Hypma_002697 [Hypsizygus marmoreus]|uniref:Uncharacterized protein n=1 Tax=Hypsizygus marmoreus TaxID=39966 RepID=A0A369J7R0_HYPMA|nr:hypothetical protein Hypma_002697 [Hypsizygus marmoreus]